MSFKLILGSNLFRMICKESAIDYNGKIISTGINKNDEIEITFISNSRKIYGSKFTIFVGKSYFGTKNGLLGLTKMHKNEKFYTEHEFYEIFNLIHY